MVKFFTKEDETQIIAAIEVAEKITSGEIRVHVQEHCRGKILEDAARVFKALKMDQTEQRNGVLIYIVPERNEFGVIGDKGINNLVPENYWDDVRDIIQQHFRAGNFGKGIEEAITKIGKKLQEHFPYQIGDVNELPDDISYG